MVKQTETRPPSSQYRDLETAQKIVIERAQAIAVDNAIRGAERTTKSAIRGVGLGRLAGAVGSTSSLRRGRTRGTNAFGAMFGRGGDDSRGALALDAFNAGVTIVPRKGKYLWYQTKAMARNLSIGGRRGRLTPARYIAAGSPLGPLRFREVRPGVAIYYAEKLLVSPKTGRARRPGPRKSRTAIAQRRVTLFIGIKFNRLAKRFDAGKIVGAYFNQLPSFIIKEIVRQI